MLTDSSERSTMIQQVLEIAEQEAVVLDLQHHVERVHDRVHGQVFGKHIEAGLRGDNPAVQGDADVVFPGHKRLTAILHHRLGPVAAAVHQAVALRGEGVLIGLERPVIPLAEPLRVPTAEAQGALALIRPLLLLHLQHGEVRLGAVGAQPDLPAQLQAVTLSVKS